MSPRRPSNASVATAEPPARGPVPPARVSTTSAERFARRVRHRRWRRILWFGLVLGLVAALVWTVLWSPWLRLRSVEVRGVHRIEASQVQALASPDVGRAMVGVSTDALAQRVRALRLVKGVAVERVWPGSLRIVIDERRPVAAVAQNGRVSLVDDEAVVVETRSTWPAGLPRIDVDVRRQGPVAMSAALRVRAALPPALLAQVKRLGADSADDVWLRLDSGAVVRWGDDRDPGLKLAALEALRRESAKAKTYDVSAPMAPAYTP